MADAERRRRIQHAHEPSHLTYGHFGTATYDSDVREWRFLRRGVGDTRRNQHEDEPNEELDVASDCRSGNGSLDLRVIHEKWHDGKARFDFQSAKNGNSHGSFGPNHILNFYPEAVPGIDLATKYARDPQTNSSFDNENQFAERLAFGQVRLEGDRDRDNGNPITHTLAYVTGIDSDTIHVAVLDKQSVTIQEESGATCSLQIPGITGRPRAKWSSSGEPILQICFPSPYAIKDDMIMAVRMPSRTTFFILQLRSESGTDPLDGQSLNPPLKLSPVLEIPASRTGGHPHAYFAFHSRTQKVMSIIDTHGNWSVWRLEVAQHQATAVPIKTHLQFSGKIFGSVHESNTTNGNQFFDGWHRNCWLLGDDYGDDILFCCNRRNVWLYNSDGKHLGYLDMRLGMKTSNRSILDLKSSLGNPNCCVVLTSQRILLVRLVDRDRRGSSDAGVADIVCSWSHFRDQHDLTLRLALLEFEDVIQVILYSKLNTKAMMYQFHINLDGSVYSSHDPVPFSVPNQSEKRPFRITDLTLRAVRVRNTKKARNVDDHQYIKVVACSEEVDVVEALYHSSVPGTTSATIEKLTITVPTSRQTRPRNAEVDNFIVQDEVADEFLYNHLHTRKLAHQVHDSNTPEMLKILDWTDLLNSIEDTTKHPSLKQSLHVLEARFSNLEQHDWKAELLVNIMEEARISDVEHDSDSFNTWLENMIAFESFELFRSTQAADKTLVDMYQSFMEKFVLSLARILPDRLRVNAERLSRQVVFDLVLSSITIRPQPATTQTDESQKQTALSRPEAIMSSPLPSSPPVEYPEPSSQITPSGILGSVQDPLIRRLSQYTTFNRRLPARVTSQVESSILAHLPTSIATDPFDYSYRDVELNILMSRNELLGQNLDPRAKRKAEKLAEAKKKRLEKQQTMAQTIALQRAMLPNVVMSSQGPARDLRSSPGIRAIESQGNEAGVTVPGLSMTQPERGVYGVRPGDGRKNKARGKKVRRQGF